MNTTSLGDTISIELVWDDAMIVTEEELPLSHRILDSTKILWEFIETLRHATLSDNEITRGCAIAAYLKTLLEEYEEKQLHELDSAHYFFAKVVVMAWYDLCE